MGENFGGSPEGHKDKADWDLEERDDFKVIRESILFSGNVFKISWNSKTLGGDRLSVEPSVQSFENSDGTNKSNQLSCFTNNFLTAFCSFWLNSSFVSNSSLNWLSISLLLLNTQNANVNELNKFCNQSERNKEPAIVYSNRITSFNSLLEWAVVEVNCRNIGA